MDAPSGSLNHTGHDEIFLVLGKSKAAEWKQFTKDIDSCESEKEKYALCLRKRDELFLTDDDWAGKQYAEVQKQKRLEEQKRSEAEKERALADGSAHPMQYLRFAIQSHEEAQNSEASPVDSTGMLQS